MIKQFLSLIAISTLSFNALANDCPTNPSETAKNFYFDYLTSYMDGKEPIKESKIQKSSTTKLIVTVKKLKHSGEDYVLKSQDYFDEWVSNINIKDEKTVDNESNLKVVLGNSVDNYNTLNVNLVKDKSCWKINSVNE